MEQKNKNEQIKIIIIAHKLVLSVSENVIQNNLGLKCIKTNDILRLIKLKRVYTEVNNCVSKPNYSSE